jgi:hypothetical protein
VIVLDTGPIVAMSNRNDQHHESCARFLSTVEDPLLLPEPLLSEVGYMLWVRSGPRVEADFLRDVADGVYDLVALDGKDVRRVGELVEKYSGLPLGTADASVVAVAEKFSASRIATIDRRHFSVVRPKHIPAFTLLP